MREISTKPYEVGEHVMIDGVEYVVENGNEDGTCTGCGFRNADCHYLTCDNMIFKKLESEPRLMTNRQLSEWLARGNGERNYYGSEWTCSGCYSYEKSNEDTEVRDTIRIRPWDSSEWVVPTWDIYERDCKAN